MPPSASLWNSRGARRGKALKPSLPDERRSISSQGGNVTVTATAMDFFASVISGWLHRPVFDETGLSGSFDFQFSYDPDDSPSSDRPGLAEALIQQLGLRLENATKPVDIVVVDHIDRTPSSN